MWASFVELLRASIFTAAHLFGGNLGAGILFVSAAVRVALLPITLKAARQMRAQQEKLAALQPQLARIQARHERDPARMLVETQKLHAKHGIRPVTPGTLLSFGVQMPIARRTLCGRASGARLERALPLGARSRAAGFSHSCRSCAR